MNNLERLLYLRGVSAEYFNYSGERIIVPHRDRLRFLEETGYDPQDEQSVQRAVYELDARPWQSWLKPLYIVTDGDAEHLDICVHSDESQTPLNWRVTSETGQQTTGELVPAELREVGEYYIEGARYAACRLPLPTLPIGYHQVALWHSARREQAQLIRAPARCFDGDSRRRLWGVICQLYTLRSERNWGIGDFSDLRELIELSAAAGVDLIALNPLHAPYMSGADFASPYSPSDRRFLNPLYIDPQQVPDFVESEAASPQFDTDATRDELAGLRELELVDYDAVAALKYRAFAAMFRHFVQHHLGAGTERAAQFNAFVEQKGEPLRVFAQFEAGCANLPVDCATEPRFHQYLQWLADQQLRQCQQLALASGMAIGLMGDLAVGAVQGGAEVEGNPGLFCRQATIGAPPDPFAEQGQNWNLPALDPVALRRSNYRHFIDLLRANMGPYGALRIDHVMGLLRLWWCLPNVSGGAYVYYPFEDLLAILRLESHRNQCLVVGEDMGVVPDEVRQRMAETSVYGNRLFYFERCHDRQFKQPRDHQPDALLMVTNHDVPTLAGWWNATDLQLRCEIGLLDAERDLPSLRRQRREDKGRLLAWLQSLQLLPEGWAADDSSCEKPFDLALCGAILAGNARSRSKILLCALDDLQLLRHPVNIPGTYREYPNWRRKLALDAQSLFGNSQVGELMASIRRERMQ